MCCCLLARVKALCLFDLAALCCCFQLGWLQLQCCHKAELCCGSFPLTCQALHSLQRGCCYQGGGCLERDKKAFIQSFCACVCRVVKEHSTIPFFLLAQGGREKLNLKAGPGGLGQCCLPGAKQLRSGGALKLLCLAASNLPRLKSSKGISFL